MSLTRAKVADFGISRAQRPEDAYRAALHEAQATHDVQQSREQQLLSNKLSSVGTLRYMPPSADTTDQTEEEPTKVDLFADDVYAYGLLLYEVLHGEIACESLPFEPQRNLSEIA